MTRRSLPTRSILGLGIVVLGVLMTLDNLGFIDFDEFWEYWPVLLLLVGLSKLASGEAGKGLFWLGFGTVFMLPLVREDFEWDMLWDYWPLALIAAGLNMVVKSFAPRRHRQGSVSAGDGSETAADGTAADETVADETVAAEVDAFAFLSTVKRRSDATDFRHGELTAVLGGCELDLSRAEVAPEGAVVEIFAFWGGVELRIPDHWAVDPQVAVLMGGIEDKTRQQANPTGRLIVKGFALMGGLEIRN